MRKRISLALLLFSLCSILLLGLGVFLSQKEELAYQDFCKELFTTQLSGNTLTLHYTLAHPEKYGISESQAVLPLYSEKDQEENLNRYSAYLEKLSGIQQEKLSEESQYNYELLLKSLTLDQQLESAPYFQEPLSPSSGMQTLLPVLFSEYRFDSIQDVDNYLSLLSQVDNYYESILEFEKEKQLKGLFMSTNTAAKVVHQCEAFISKEAVTDGSHFLVDTFMNRLKDFQLRYPHSLSDEDFAKYCAENTSILIKVLIPAYQKLADQMQSLSDENLKNSPSSAFHNHGLGISKEGQLYFVSLLQKCSGSYRTPEEIQDLLYEDFESNYEALTSLQRASQSADSADTAPLEKDFDATLNNPAQILSSLESVMNADFPPYPSKEKISCHVKKLSPSLSKYSAPAFYLTPQADGYDNNVIYLNPKSNLTGLSLFTTLAHEGYPGHLYQTVYSQMNFANSHNPIRNILSYEGYSEGWAFYTELKSYEYAAIYYHSGNTDYDVLSRKLQLSLCALLDFSIHYHGMDEAHTIALLEQLGIQKESALAIFEYITEEPCCYLKYYLSYLEVLSLQKNAKTLWGSSYSDYRFHKFYLDAGPSDFESLQALLMNTEIE